MSDSLLLSWALGALVVLLIVVVGLMGAALRDARRQLAHRRALYSHARGAEHELGKLALHWEKRFWSLHTACERLIGERDGWKNTYDESVRKHLNGQAVLSQALTTARAQARALHTLLDNRSKRLAAAQRLLDKKGTAAAKRLDEIRKAITGPVAVPNELEVADLDDYPRQLVEEYFEQIRSWNTAAKKSQQDLKKALSDDREHWREHFAELASLGAPGTPGDDGDDDASVVPVPEESLEGMTIQEMRRL